MLADLEAYLNAIYTTLEIAASINRRVGHELPIGFRKQAKKYAPFSFERWPWLPHFYDVRTELVHYGSGLPAVRAGKFIMEFARPADLYLFKPGKHEIEFNVILQYAMSLYGTLDAWALEHLDRVDPQAEILTFSETSPFERPKSEKGTAEAVLQIVRLYKQRAQEYAAGQAMSAKPDAEPADAASEQPPTE